MIARMLFAAGVLTLVSGCNEMAVPDVDSSDGNGEAHASVAVSEQDFSSVVLESEQPVVVDFWAPWCGPCKQMGPVVEEVAAEFEGRAVVAKVNTDENQQLAEQYNITGIPAFVFFKDGQEVDRFVGGGRSKEDFANKLNDLIQGS